MNTRVAVRHNAVPKVPFVVPKLDTAQKIPGGTKAIDELSWCGLRASGPSHTVRGARGAAKLGSRLPLGGPYERCASTSVLKSSEVLPRRRSFARQVGLLSVEVGAPCCASHPSSTGWAPTVILEAPSRVCI